jgi:hypothetical protein
MSETTEPRMNDYETLKAAGHSPAKAAEIVLDAGRGDAHALRWISICREQTHTRSSKMTAI